MHHTEMSSREMYVTLPSSASLDIYPSNTLAHFTTELSSPIYADPELYEIGLAEFQLDAYIYNVNEDKDSFTIERSADHVQNDVVLLSKQNKEIVDHAYIKNTEYVIPRINNAGGVKFVPYEENNEIVSRDSSSSYSVTLTVPKGFYPCIRSFLDAMNKQLMGSFVTEDLRFILKKKVSGSASSYKVELVSKYGLSLKNEKQFALFKSPWIKKAVSDGGRSENEYQLNFIFDYDLLVHVPKIAYIYCNIIDHQYVGDIKTQLLRTVHIPRNKGSMTVIYENPHYIDLASEEIRTVEIYIKDVEGKNIPFDRGTLSVKLHIRKKRL